MENEIPVVETPVVPGANDTPVVETTTTEGGFKEVTDEEVQEMLRGGKKTTIETPKPVVETPVAPAAVIPEPPAPIVPPVVTNDNDYIKIPKSSLNGIFNDDVAPEAIIDRLKTGSLTEDDKIALEKGKILLGRPDLQGLINHAVKPNANIAHYVDLMKQDVTKLSDFDAIVQLGVLEGKNPDQYRSKLRGDYMQFDDSEYAEYGPERLQSLKDAATIKLQEDGENARNAIAKMQADAQRPESEQVANAERDQYVQTKKLSEEAWRSEIPKVVAGNKIESTLKFKGTDDAEVSIPFTFDLTKPERQSEIQKFTEEYIKTILTYNPQYTPTEQTIKEAKQAAVNSYIIAHKEEIFSQIAVDINAEADLRWAQKTNNPRLSQVVNSETPVTPGSGFQQVSDQEVIDMMNRS